MTVNKCTHLRVFSFEVRGDVNRGHDGLAVGPAASFNKDFKHIELDCGLKGHGEDGGTAEL